MTRPRSRWYVDGAWVAPERALVSVADAGFELGDGLFETLLVYAGRPLEVGEHLARLARGARRLELALPQPTAGLEEIVARVAAGIDAPWGRLRVTLTRGAGGKPTLAVRGTAYEPPVQLAQRGAEAHVAPSAWVLSSDPLAGLKSTSYQRMLLASRHAAAKGAWELLLTNERGELVEGSRTNLFVRTSDGWLTPPLAAGCLPGVVRAKLLRAGWAREATLRPAMLSGEVTAAGLTNSLVGFVPLRTIDGRPLQVEGEARTLARRLAALRGLPPPDAWGARESEG